MIVEIAVSVVAAVGAAAVVAVEVVVVAFLPKESPTSGY